ncbi:unnamed protein product [Calypogeia fissa]
MKPTRVFGVVALLVVQFLALEVTFSNAAVVARVPQGPHISSLNLLLPPRTTRPIRFRLLGFNGCFTWSWDHHDILSVEPEFNATVKHCSTSAVLTSVAPYSSRRATAVHATDIFTGQILRCEVFIDKISRIRIFHHSLKLDLDGVATLRILAFDSEENVFSSLVGLQFVWQLSPVNTFDDFEAHRLMHVPLKDTALGDGEIDFQIEMEQAGVDSDLYVVRGIAVGQERVTAQLMEPLFEDLSDVVVLTVAEAISLEPPSPIYIIPGTRLQYTLKTLRNNVATVVPLPSPHHRWFSANTSVAEIDSSMGIVVGRTHGATSVVVKDTRLDGHQQTSMLHVVTPVTLRLYLTPLTVKGENQSYVTKEAQVMSSDVPWQLVVARKYIVQVFTFSKESGTRPLQLTKDNELRRLFANQGVWLVDDCPENIVPEQERQHCSLLQAIREGTGTLVATLAHGIMVRDEVTGNWLLANKKVLREEVKVVVCSPVKIAQPPSDESGALLLPWIPGHGQQYPLHVEGGCGEQPGDYWWISSNAEIASVNALGVVKAQGLGKALIRVSPTRDPLNYDEIIVDVSVPAFMNAFPGLPVEVKVPGTLPVGVTLLNPGGKNYSVCDSFNPLVQWDIAGAENSFVQLNKTSEGWPLLGPEEPTPCAWNLLLATRAGRATVTATLSIPDSMLGSESPGPSQRLLETSWTIAAYMPMWLEQGGDGNCYGGYSSRGGDMLSSPDGTGGSVKGLTELLLSLGSSMRVIVRGGPERWRHGVEFVESIMEERDGAAPLSGVGVAHLTEGAGRVYRLTCTGLGTHIVIFNRGNLVGNDHPVRAVASASLSVHCAVPSEVVLLIDEPENSVALIKNAVQADRDANRVRTTPFTVINGRTIRVASVAITSGKPFANASSLYLNWNLRECNGLVQWQLAEKSDRAHEEDGWERFLTLGNASGVCIVEASVGGILSRKDLDQDALFKAIDELAKAAPMLKDAAPLQLVSALRLEPRELLLFFHPEANARFLVLGGTLDVVSRIQDSRVAVLSHQRLTSGLVELVVKAKGLGTTFVTVRDVGVATPSEASAMVLVADVAWVKMLIPEDASILLGSNMTIQLEAGDEAGHIFDPFQFQYMHAKIYAQDDIVEVVDVSANTFTIRGKTVGLTSTLHVSVRRHTGQEILSDFGRVAVFAPISIHPRSLVIAAGGQYVLTAQGGPRVGATIEFSSSSSDVALIDKATGRLKGITPGNLTIYAQAKNPLSVVITEDSVEVRVVDHITPVLNVRGGQLGVDREMSIFPAGAEEDLLSFADVCHDYKWSIGDKQVLSFRHTESSAGSGGDGRVKGGSVMTDTKWALSSGVYGSDGVTGTQEGFAVRVVGKSAGRAKVTVSFTCHFGNGDGIAEPKQYVASNTIWVVPPPPLALGIPATWLLRPQYTSSSLLPQWTEEFPSRTDTGGVRQNVLYTVMHEGNELGGISIIEDGRIRTTERLELACIHARDRNTGRAEVAACIHVAEVSEVMGGGDDFPYHVAELSVGASQDYVVTLADEFGAPFYETGRGTSLLVLDTNRADIVSMKVSECDHNERRCNLTITVQALEQGTALVRVSFRGIPHIVDFVLVKVGAFVNPRNPSVHIGGQVNFTVLGKGTRGTGLPKDEYGHWTSDNPSVLQIDSHSGYAKAVGEGTSIVSFVGPHLTTYTSTTVIRISSMTLEKPAKYGLLTNVGHDEGYRFPVKFSDSQGYDVGILGENQEVSYECGLEPPFLGLAVPWREPGSSTFFCVFFPFPPTDIYRLEETKKLVSSAGGSNGTMQFKIIAVVPGDPPVLGSLQMTIVGGFQIVNAPEQLHLSPTTNRSLITLIGNSGQVQVSWKRTDVMVVKKITDIATPGIADRVVYEVKLSAEDQSFTDRVVFSIPATGQKEEFPVTYNAEIQVASLLAKPLLTAVMLVVTLLLLPLIFCARLLDLPRPAQEAQLNGPEPPSDGPLLSTGEQTPPTMRTFGHTSPPQPYTDYISRTIEKTPYYKREGMRRFDPSRTY